jgi:hypothetical protein
MKTLPVKPPLSLEKRNRGRSGGESERYPGLSTFVRTNPTHPWTNRNAITGTQINTAKMTLHLYQLKLIKAKQDGCFSSPGLRIIKNNNWVCHYGEFLSPGDLKTAKLGVYANFRDIRRVIPSFLRLVINFVFEKLPVEFH